MEWKEGQALTWVDPPCTYLSSHHFMSKGLAHAPFHSLRCRRVRVWHTFMACRLSSKVGNLPRLPGSYGPACIELPPVSFTFKKVHDESSRISLTRTHNHEALKTRVFATDFGDSSYEPEPIMGSQASSFFLPILYSQRT